MYCCKIVRSGPGRAGNSCGKFRSPIECDPYELCKSCSKDDKCNECDLWSEGQWTKIEVWGKYRPRKQSLRSFRSQVMDDLNKFLDSFMPFPAQLP